MQMLFFFFMIEGLQITAFLTYQLLTLPLWADPLPHIPFSWLSHTSFNITIIIDCLYIYNIQHYSLLLNTLTALTPHVILNKWLYTFFFIAHFSISTTVVNWQWHWQQYLVVAWLVPHETAAVSVQVLCTTYNQAPVYSVTSFKAT